MRILSSKEPCMAISANNAISLGSTRKEVIESAAVGVKFGGGGSYTIVRNHLLNFLDEIEGSQ